MKMLHKGITLQIKLHFQQFPKVNLSILIWHPSRDWSQHIKGSYKGSANVGPRTTNVGLLTANVGLPTNIQSHKKNPTEVQYSDGITRISLKLKSF